ncbi:hypothetical protein [Kitasatospora sp. NPDC057198]|uniref:hypothetical protein n=1 Tax=Kitasatospora sp. NPDC057198 TaxID=3346046 RepID=UPI003642BB25
MSSTPPRTTGDRPEAAPAAGAVESAGPAGAGPSSRTAVVPPVPMRALLAACRAAEAVSTPPERHAA